MRPLHGLRDRCFKTTGLLRVWSLLVLVLVFMATSGGAQPTRLSGTVVGIQDGDTLTIIDAQRRQYRIRLAGIDAPEKRQAFGNVSRRALSDLVFSRKVDLHVTKVDRYGRLVAKVLHEGQDVCKEQIRKGLAWLYADYESELTPEDRASYSAAQREAKKAHRGLWRDSEPMPPWQFRRNARAGVRRHQALAATASGSDGKVMGNKRSRIYHLPQCPGWGTVAPKNREYYSSESAAIAAGYRKAKNCP